MSLHEWPGESLYKPLTATEGNAMYINELHSLHTTVSLLKGLKSLLSHPKEFL